MKFLFLFLVSHISLLLPFVHATDLNEYLNEKLRQSKIEFIKIHIQETSPVQEKSYRVHWDRTWQIPIMSEHQPFIVDMLDEVFILDGNRIMTPSLNATYWNETYNGLREVYWIRRKSFVKFVRSIVWQDTGYLLVCYESSLCNLHTAKPNQPLRFRHTIGCRGIPVDAKFFTQADQLYLIIANNADKFPVPSVIYRWSGTYMDIVKEVIMIGAVSITAFNYRQSTIIVFAQSNDENPSIGSEVYEFKDNNIVRIQFLSTARPTSVHYYVHSDFNFVLMINDLGPSDVLCWDGGELLDWFSLPDIKSHSLISTFHLDGNTFVIMAHDNIIQLYKFHSTSDWKSEDVKYFKDNQKIVDMTVSMNENTLNVTLILLEKDLYWVEQWQIEITSVPIDNNMGDTDAIKKCLSKLIEILQARMPAVIEAEASWKFLSPSSENLTISKPVNFDSLILQSGRVDDIEIASEEDIVPPGQIARAMDELDRSVHDIQAEYAKLQPEMRASAAMLEGFKEKIVAADVYLDELVIDQMHVDFVNDVNVQSEKMILSEGEQHLTKPLRAKNVIVHDLEVESLCGITPEYWMLRDDEGLASVIPSNFLEYTNDTVILHSNLTVPKLKITSLNGTVIDQLIDDLFIINRNQKIKGTITYVNSIEILNLTAQMVNGISADKLMTITTNQSFDDFYVKTLYIKNLSAERINGVPIEEAARKSRENVIKGKLKLAKLCITEDLVIDTNESTINIPEQLQLYQNVTILGDLYVENIQVENATELLVEDVPVNVADMFDRYWTKSTNQTITEEITLEAGITIDKLDAKYLNGLAESDFLYTTMEEIPSDFTNLRFENFHVDQFFDENSPNETFFEVEPESLTIRGKLHVETLRASDIITLAFNGVSVDDIMNETPVNFSGNVELPVARARRVLVDNLDVRLVNDREVLFENELCVDDNHQLPFLNISEFHVENLEVERLNGIEMNLMRLMDLTNSDLSDIIIDGDLTVENLMVDQVDGRSTESFLEELSRSDIVIPSERSIEELVVQNITLTSLRGRDFDDLIASVLLKSKEQTITGHFSAQVVISDDVTTDFINERNVSQLMWVDEPLTITGNVTFSDLYVEGEVNIPQINGRNVRELYDSLLYIPVENIDLLEVYGNVSWDLPSASPGSMSYLLNNAVTKDRDQVITGDVTFEKDVRAWAVSADYTEIDEIQSIISDSVVRGEPIEIKGTKIFEEDFVAQSLTVTGDLGIAKINDVDILEFNNSVVRQNQEDTIVGSVTFLGDVMIERLYVNNADINASVNAAVRATDVMPDNIVFEELEVLGDVHLEYLDNVDFDKFVKNRVTLSGDHNISCDVSFNGVVTVTGNANIGKINGIYPSDFVLNDIDEMQIINGVKTFKEDLIVDGDVVAPRINNIDVIKEYGAGVQNIDGDIEIFGDLIFKAKVRIQNISSSGLVNGVNLRSVTNSQEKINKTIKIVEDQWRIIDQNIKYSSQISETLGNVFFYLEEEKGLEIPGTNVSKIDVIHFDESEIRLNMYSERPGAFCGLPDNCSCTYQSVVKLIESDNANRTTQMQSREMNPGEITKDFHDPDEMLGVKVITNTISSSKECTSTGSRPEYTTISVKSNDLKMNHEDVFNRIEGYWKDAKIFKHDGNLYIVLAVYYDKARATHRTNTLLYRVHLIRNTEKQKEMKQELVQKIPTDGAWSVQIFKIDHEIFLLIGCFGESSESLLYRFDPTTEKFQQLRTFVSRSRYVKSLSQGTDHFVLLDNPDTNAVNIYKYNPKSRNFDSYQSIFHFHQINGIERFYTDGFGDSDVFVIVTTQSGRFYVYEYMFAGKFQMKLQHIVNNLRTMMPFYYANNHYILAGTDNNNIIFRIVKQGPH